MFPLVVGSFGGIWVGACARGTVVLIPTAAVDIVLSEVAWVGQNLEGNVLLWRIYDLIMGFFKS